MLSAYYMVTGGKSLYVCVYVYTYVCMYNILEMIALIFNFTV